MASEAVLRRLQRIGQGSISADQGLLALAAVLRGAAATAAAPALPQLAVNAFLWDTYLRSSQPAFFAELAPERLAPAQQQAQQHGAAVSTPGARPAAALDPAAVREQVKSQVAAAIVQASGQGHTHYSCKPTLLTVLCRPPLRRLERPVCASPAGAG